ncbi:MAG TPA: 7-carboxy-7-deazaguanine synthase QueE [Planctomycetes bacterium]|nr:7-carboxy-7-deazaguanine synthase QueE [Planctomycetota bacterium]
MVRDRGSETELVVNELYASVQGEGTRAGQPCMFVRLTGCGLRCRWCDTAYAFYEGQRRPLDEVVSEVLASGIEFVLLTGGEPLEQPGCLNLAKALCDAGRTVAVETGGHVDTSALDPRVTRILDVKCPGSKMAKRNRPEELDSLRATDEVKFVVADRADFDFAREVIARHGLAERGCALLFSPVHGELEPAELATWLLEDPLPSARLNLQLHKLIWPRAERGV